MVSSFFFTTRFFFGTFFGVRLANMGEMMDSFSFLNFVQNDPNGVGSPTVATGV